MNEQPNPYHSPQADSLTPESWEVTPIRVHGELTLVEARRVFDHLGGQVGLILWCLALPVLWLVVLGGSFVVHLIAVRSLQPAMYIVIFFILLLGVLAQGGFICNVLEARELKRLHAQRQGVFRYAERKITDEAISCRWGEIVRTTPWSDYRGYQLTAHAMLLRLNRAGLVRRRREQPHQRAEWWRFFFLVDTDAIDLFPRVQFDGDGDWQDFVTLVRRKVRRL